MTDSRNDIGAPFPQRKEMDHDPLCFLAQFPGKAAQAVGPDACTCAIIRAARADERERMQHVDFYAASVARRVVLADLRAKVEAVDPVEWALAGQDAGRMFIAMIDGSSE